MPRKYTHMLEHESKILEMHAEGKSRQEMADTLGLEKLQIKEFIKRHNRRKKEGHVLPKQRGRKPAVTLQEYKYENKRLKMENDLLRSFLHAAGRR